ncbi:UNVERIFIED_CONTAM: hypothetical protein Slati_2211600 [Sesamum latifolium]|uniref:DUF4283 domain-containing protein n=1 Tax=Sesamum latifolium TaxID=2727402 RepID=A0AAW2WS63_9LAMI
MEIVDHLPRLEDSDGVRWNSTTGEFTISDAYRLFQPPGPTVGWHYYYVALSASHGIASSYGLQSWRGCPHLTEHVDRIGQHMCTVFESVNMPEHAFGFWKQRFGLDCQGLVGNTPSYGRLEDGEIEEFLELAHRVIDDGDDWSWAALGELKRKWEAKVCPLKSSGQTTNPPMMSANPLVWSVRKALRTLKPIPPTAATLNLTGIAGSLSMGAATHNPNMHAPMENPNLHAPSTVAPTTSLAEEILLAQLATMPILAGSSSSPDYPEEPTEARSPRVSGNTPIGETVPTPCGAGSSSDFLGGGDTDSGCGAAGCAAGRQSNGIFLGSVPLHATRPLMQPDNTSAETFTTSSRKTLRYVPPDRQNGETVVRPTIDMIKAGSKRWESTVIGHFLGHKPSFYQMNDFASSTWPSVREVIATANGFFFIQFKTVVAMEEVLEGGPWLFQGQPIVLQRWEPGMTLRKRSHTQVPIWIKLRHLPVELWTPDGLSTVASGVVRPLYPDVITKAGTRLDYARVCVLIDFSSTLPKHLIILAPDEDGGEHPCCVDIDMNGCRKNVWIVERWGIRLLNVLPGRKLLGLRSPCLSKSHSPRLKPWRQLSVWTLPRSRL